jgi:hypothetical protein
MNDLPLANPDLLALMSAALARGAPFRFRALGSSMSPFIREGDVLTVAPLRSGEPALGQVVAFIHPDSGLLLVHRVVGRPGPAPLVQGDNTPGRSDGLVPPENILGRVTQVKRNGKKVLLGLGPERYALAPLSRFGLLRPFIERIKTIKKILQTGHLF